MPNRLRVEPRRLIWSGVVMVSLLAVAWLAIRAAVVRALPANSAPILAIAPQDGQTVLDRATLQNTFTKASPRPVAYAPILAAAASVPLDDRPFLLLGIRALADGHEATGIKLLEEGRRRNPRQRYTRLLLLDRYLRANRTSDAVVEMTVLNRLLPGARDILAGALAGLAVDPATTQQVRRALDDDPELLNQVLVAMAAKTNPAAIQRFAGLRAPAGLMPTGWRTVLIQAMIDRGQFGDARRLWTRAYRVDPARSADAIYDAPLQGAQGGPPFNWTLAANEIGAAEIGGGALTVEYYGRRAGPLASQLVVLGPGRYRLAYAVSGSGGDSNGGLAWSLTCQAKPAVVIANSPTGVLRPTAHMVATALTVPATGCPAQLLSLDGQSGGFAGSTSVRITRLALDRLP